MGVGHSLPHQRQRGVMRRVDFADHAAEIKFEIGFELAGKLLHAAVVDQAMHLQGLHAAVARAQQGPFEQHRADAMALPWLLDAEGGFSRPREKRSDGAQLRRAAQDAIDEKAMQHNTPLGQKIEAEKNGDTVLIRGSPVARGDYDL